MLAPCTSYGCQKACAVLPMGPESSGDGQSVARCEDSTLLGAGCAPSKLADLQSSEGRFGSQLFQSSSTQRRLIWGEPVDPEVEAFPADAPMTCAGCSTQGLDHPLPMSSRGVPAERMETSHSACRISETRLLQGVSETPCLPPALRHELGTSGDVESERSPQSQSGVRVPSPRSLSAWAHRISHTPQCSNVALVRDTAGTQTSTASTWSPAADQQLSGLQSAFVALRSEVQLLHSQLKAAESASMRGALEQKRQMTSLVDRTRLVRSLLDKAYSEREQDMDGFVEVESLLFAASSD